MEPWAEQFAKRAERLQIAETTTIENELGGLLAWRPDRKCAYGCMSGVVYGKDIDIGEFFRVGDAEYCPSCGRVVLVKRTEVSVDPAPFLQTVNKKVREGAEHRYLVDRGICPLCQTTAKVLTEPGKAKGATNTWKVCPKPGCSYPGEHKVV